MIPYLAYREISSYDPSIWIPILIVFYSALFIFAIIVIVSKIRDKIK